MVRKDEVAENIKRFRYAAKITQKELADISGLSLPTIKNIESGKPGARLSTIMAIANALNIGVEAIVKPARRLRTISFRGLKYMRSREGVVAAVVTKLDNYNALEELLDNTMLPVYKELLKQESDPLKLAQTVRIKSGLSTTESVGDIIDVVTTLGIKMLSVSVETDRFIGLSVGESDGGPAIIINENSRFTFEQTVFAIACELAHILMNGNKKDNYIADIETERAKKFASYFLLPEDGLHSHWSRSGGLAWFDKVIKIKQIYGVASSVVIERISDTKTYPKLMEQFEQHFQTTDNKEPFKLEKILFIENRFTGLAVKAVKQKLIKPDNAAEILGITIDEMNKFSKQIEAV
jgi:Zn-dependent peptidase ImmA (M78 family)/DNA-binding XRE family transcriptional regulator